MSERRQRRKKSRRIGNGGDDDIAGAEEIENNRGKANRDESGVHAPHRSDGPSAKKRRKSAPLRGANKRPPTPDDRAAEYRSMGCAYYSTMFKLLSTCVGETIADIQAHVDPVRADREEFDGVMARIEATARALQSATRPPVESELSTTVVAAAAVAGKE
jgi:hypothetical protein